MSRLCYPTFSWGIVLIIVLLQLWVFKAVEKVCFFSSRRNFSDSLGTLLNKLFGTKFCVMNAEVAQKQTTRGVWLGKAYETAEPILVCDIEGSDSYERGEQKVKLFLLFCFFYCFVFFSCSFSFFLVCFFFLFSFLFCFFLISMEILGFLIFQFLSLHLI